MLQTVTDAMVGCLSGCDQKADQSMRRFEQRLRESSMQTVTTLQACCNSLTEGNALTGFSERYVMTAVKSYEAFENVVPLAVQKSAVVAA